VEVRVRKELGYDGSGKIVLLREGTKVTVAVPPQIDESRWYITVSISALISTE
jgi:hypothetical protein